MALSSGCSHGVDEDGILTSVAAARTITAAVSGCAATGMAGALGTFSGWCAMISARPPPRRPRFGETRPPEEVSVRHAARIAVLTATCAVLSVSSGRLAAQQNSTDIKSLHVQGNVWMLVGPVSNAVVQIGEDGVLVVDTMMEQNADAMVAEIKRLAPNKIIRYVVNTHVHLDHTGGNEKVAAAGRTLVAGNFAGQVAADSPATIIAHENVLNRMSAPTGKQSSRPTAAWPNDSFFDDQKDLFFNGEGVELIHIPSAHTDGDLMVYFRKSDVLAAGDLYVNNTFPIVMTAEGGSYNGILTALNKIIDICIPRDKEEGRCR